jgi:cytochrome P450
LSWTTLRKFEERYGDTFMIVSPSMCYFKTSNAELANQITTRRADFRKPVHRYKVVDMFGGSILTQEGAEWKRHRKVVGPSFSEKSNKLVFEESLKQAAGMMENWALNGSSRDDVRVSDCAAGTAELSLNVICAAGFGVPQLWPHESVDKLGGKGVEGFSGHEPMKGHDYTLKKALVLLLDNILWFAAFNPWMLSPYPFAPYSNPN